MQDVRITAQVHRFRDHVAIFLNNGEIIYLPPTAAKTFGQALVDCANEIENVPNFQHSTIGSKEWTFNGKR